MNMFAAPFGPVNSRSHGLAKTSQKQQPKKKHILTLRLCHTVELSCNEWPQSHHQIELHALKARKNTHNFRLWNAMQTMQNSISLQLSFCGKLPVEFNKCFPFENICFQTTDGKKNPTPCFWHGLGRAEEEEQKKKKKKKKW